MKLTIDRLKIYMLIGAMIAIASSCSWEPSDDVRPATFPTTAEVFIDGFSGGLEYLPFGGSKLDAFTVDDQTFYEGTAAMRFDVPNFGDAGGAFAGAIFPDYGGRDLSQFDALTFWAKSTKAAFVNEIGFGQDFGENKFQVTARLRLTTGWQKYTIPIPDPSLLTKEDGMFWYSEGPEGPTVNDNGTLVDLGQDGYTFWVDELKFEKLGTLAQPRPAMFNGQAVTERAFVGSALPLTGLTQTVNLANGSDQTVNAAPSYYTFQSSNPSVATVSEQGIVSVVGQGTAEITAILAGVKAKGSLTVESLGQFVSAPTPTQDPANVISIFSDAYNNVPVDFYNGFFAPFQTTLGGADLNINGDNVIQYTQLNFVASEFKNPTIDATAMTHLHVDIQIQENIDAGYFIAIELGDFGPDNAFGGENDASSRITFSSNQLRSGEWISLDIPLSDFAGLGSRANLAQIFFISDATISTLLVDNIYLYR